MRTNTLKGRKQSPEHIAKRTEAVARARASWTPEKHQAIRDAVSRSTLARDPSWREKISISKRGKPAWNKGKKCPQFSGANHWNYGNNMPQESIEKMRRSLTGKKQSPELIAKRVAGRAGYRHSPKSKEKIGKANKGENNGMFGKTGEANPTWRGGISFEPYPTTWSESLRESIRIRDHRECRACGLKENGKHHEVHHIDYNKRNLNPNNLVTICRSCHSRSNYRRHQWEEFFNGTPQFQ